LINRAAAALAAVTGDDLRRADNELLKLASYVETGKPSPRKTLLC